MKLIALSGWKKSGKDTAAELLIADYGFKRVAFADPLKNTVSQQFNIPRTEIDDQGLKEQPLLNYPVVPKDAFALNIVKFMYKEFRDAKGRIPLDIQVDASGAVVGIMDYPNYSRKEDHAQLYWTRRALCILEGSGKRTVDSNYWVTRAIEQMDNTSVAFLDTPDDEAKFVISDLRYVSEVEPLRQAFGNKLLTVRVNRFDSTESVDPSERDLDKYKFDLIIENKGTKEEFLEKINEIANNFK